MKRRLQGFTLVELIVVITILAILGTIAFSSVDRYTKDARDSVRISDFSNMRKNLELYVLATGKYPNPTNYVNITYSGSVAWLAGTFGDSVITNLAKLNKKPVDPVYGSEYSYSITNKGTEYELGGLIEGGTTVYNETLLPTAQAVSSLRAMIKGTYNGKLLGVSTGGVDYILAVPSIITSDITDTDALSIATNKKFTYNNEYNLPSTYTNKVPNFTATGGFDYSPGSKFVIFSGSLTTLGTSGGKVAFAQGLQDAYSGTILANKPTFAGLFGFDAYTNSANAEVFIGDTMTTVPQFDKTLALVDKTPKNGTCGSANGTNLGASPTSTRCTQGIATTVTDAGVGANFTWSCNGTFGGTNVSCSAVHVTDGVCGSDNGLSFGATPPTNKCTSGTASSVTDGGQGNNYTWTCNSPNGGINASCSAAHVAPTNGVCGTANGQSWGAIPASNLRCSAGNPGTVTDNGLGNTYTWSCTGIGGGTNANCSANHVTPTNGTCGTANSQTVLVTPSGGAMCATGTGASLAGIGRPSWTWNCNSVDGGTNASCSAILGNWVKTGGSTSYDKIQRMVTDTSGNIYVTGFFTGSGSVSIFGTGVTAAGNRDMLIAKFNQAGELIWIKTAGGSLNDEGRDITLDTSGNVYISGIYNGVATSNLFGTTITGAGSDDIIVAKFDNNGNNVWLKRTGGTSVDTGDTIGVDGSGNVYVAGGFINNNTDIFGTVLTNSGSYDAYIAKLDSSGNGVWTKRGGGTGQDNIKGLAITSAGTVYAVGYVDTNSNVNTNVFGMTNIPTTGTDILIIKLDTNGNTTWIKTSQSVSAEYGNDIAVDASENIYVAGYNADNASTQFGLTVSVPGGSNNNGFVGKFDSSGNVSWIKQAGGTGYDNASGISVDTSGNVYVVGEFAGTSVNILGTTFTATGTDTFAAKLDTNGNTLLVKQSGGPGAEYGKGIAVGASGKIIIVGSFDTASNSMFTQTISPLGGEDIYIAEVPNP